MKNKEVPRQTTKNKYPKNQDSTNKKAILNPFGKQTLDKKSEDKCLVIGIGASAGGLEALESLFLAMPEDSGASFVIVSHLDPSHESILPELIQKKTSMTVEQVKDNRRILPNKVYIIPPNKEMIIFRGHLQLLERSDPSSINPAIDIFFRSLAQDKKERSIGIILSGTGSDGSMGLRAIKGEGGMVMVQDINSAKYDGMPSTAIATGLVDYILTPDKMPEQLLNYINHQSQRTTSQSWTNDETMLASLMKIYALLRQNSGHDFSLYKKKTIYRRIERRMHVHQIDRITNYVHYIQESDQECSILFKELLIGVTNFFRDPKAFHSLEKKLRETLQHREYDDPIRIWVAGCCTGEEAYSIAILIQEIIEEIRSKLSIQIFGTDLDEESIKQAREGIYPESIASDVSQTRLNKYFTKNGDSFQVKKLIREMVVFAPQNITKDPPFSKLDLLCCRNLLIYFDHELQKKIIPIFHYSLKPGGLLFLGSSETIGKSTDLFLPVDKKWKIYKSHATERKTMHIPKIPTTILKKSPDKALVETASPLKEIDPLKLLKSIIEQSGMPSCVVIDDHGAIIYIHGRTGSFLEPAEGEANFNLLAMARPGLKIGLTKAVRKMAVERQEVTVNGLQVQNEGGYLNVNLLIKPLPDLQTGQRGLMIVFFDHSLPSGKENAQLSEAQKPSESKEVRKLKEELQYTKENLQTTIEELETSNEEHKSTNEELQSTNEELQSTNEELETSKEELQSLNEESVMVNSELQERIGELETSNDDMKNLLDATDIATVFLDVNLNIRRFTPSVTDLIPLTKGDIGRSISHFATTLINFDLNSLAKQVLQDLDKCVVDVSDKNNHIFRVCLRPYRTAQNVIDGIVIVFNDVTELKQLDQNKKLAVIVKDTNDAVTIHDLTGKILAWNKGAEHMYGYSESEALAMNILDIVPSSKKNETRKMFSTLLDKKEKAPLITERLRKDGKKISVWLNATIILGENKIPEAIAYTERDLSLLNKKALEALTGGGLSGG